MKQLILLVAVSASTMLALDLASAASLTTDAGGTWLPSEPLSESKKISVIEDPARGVTCWLYHQAAAGGMSCLPNSAFAGDAAFSGGAARVRVTAVTLGDGVDSYRVNVEGWPALVGVDMPVLLRGVNTHETQSRCEDPDVDYLKGDNALEARRLVEGLLVNADQIELRDVERDSFFRLVADIYLDGESLSGRLLSAQSWYGAPLALPYGDEEWCGVLAPYVEALK